MTLTPSIRPLSRHALAAAIVLATAFACSHSAKALTYYWSPTPGSLGGDGVWGTSVPNWTEDSAGNGVHVNYVSSTATSAIFGGADSTYAVTLGNTPMSWGGLNFAASGYTITAASPSVLASTVVFGSGTAGITVASGKTATIGNNVAISNTGSGSQLSAAGGGTLVFESGSSLAVTSGTGNLFLGGSGASLNTGTTFQFKAGSSLSVGQSLAISSNVQVQGATVTAGSIAIGRELNTSASALTISSGTVTSTQALRFGPASGNPASAGGTLNLDGGTLSVPQITRVGTGTSITLNFNGGTLRASGPSATFMTGLGTAQIRNGGAKVDTNTFDITIGQALIHSGVGGDNAIDGGLTKQGTGVLTLSGVSTYTGATSVQTGTLRLASTGSVASTAYSISPGAIFDVSLKGSYSLAGINTTVGVSQTNAGLLEAGSLSLTLGGDLVLNFTSGTLNGSSFDLINSTGQTGDFSTVTLTGSIIGGLTLTSADTWTGSAGAYSFTFNEGTGVLSFAAIPEPSTYALALSGLMLAIVGGRRLRRRSA
jgi:autotransporter-associated beta strand protein